VSPPPPRERRLVSIRRAVPAARRAEYDAAWARLHAAATARRAHAWRFRSADVEDVYLEFLEFGTEEDLRGDADALGAIRALHEAFGDLYPAPMTLEEWIEIPTPHEPDPT
jgi:hypothetical protein